MVVIQIVLEFNGDDNNHIQVNILEREDANALEREMAKNIQELHRTILEDIRDQLPEGEVEITVID